MYQNYRIKERFSRRALFSRLSLALAFLLSFGFAGGVLFLLFFIVPFEQWLTDRGASQDTINAILTVLTGSWILFGLCATALYARLLLMKRNLLVAVGICGASLAAASVVFFFLLNTDLMLVAGRLGQETKEIERVTFGSYPDLSEMERLREEGYDGVISLLNPTIPFEEILLRREMQNGRKVDITVISEPMLPWISENKASLEEIKKLVSKDNKRYYIHCYLGKHRVDLVKRELGPVVGESPAGEEEPLPSTLERGRIVAYEDERIILGPYPTDDEWLDVVLRREVEEIVSTLDPDNPQDVPWIEKEKQIARENDLIFTLRPLDAESPDPAAVRKIAGYARSLDHKVYVHDFLDANRFEALDSAVRESGNGTVGSGT